MNGLFFIKEEEFIIERDEVIHKYKVAGDIGWLIHFQYVYSFPQRIQCALPIIFILQNHI